VPEVADRRGLCTRSALERQRGDLAAAEAALGEAQRIADQVGSGPDSELGRLLALSRQAAQRGVNSARS